MKIPPKYQLTKNISQLLSSIEASRQVIDSHPLPKQIEQNLQRQSVLRSSLFSARIEGNPLTLDELIKTSPKNQTKIEINNILTALNWIKNNHRKEISKQTLLTLHKIAMKGLIDIDNLGQFRKNMEAIFNSVGAVIYMPPAPTEIDKLLDQLIEFINNGIEENTPIQAALAHYSFEKIHPFLDGSGRVGRLLIQLILHQNSFGMKGTLSLEEYLDNHRDEYYKVLEEPETNTTEYLEFMLESISQTAINSKNIILQQQKPNIEDLLLPRRGEILRIINEQKMVNFDQIKRRFLQINDRTLRLDLKKLQDQGLIRKLGTTKGAYYASNKSINSSS